MERDRYGLGLSTTAPEAAAAYVAGVDAFLASQDGWAEAWQRAAAADAEFALAHAASAVAASMAGSARDAECLAARAEQLPVGTVRERSHVDALTARARSAPDAVDRLVGHVEQYPLDALALMFAVFAVSASARASWIGDLAALVQRSARHYPGEDWFMLSLHAFALEETRRHAEARPLAERSLLTNPTNARAVHVLTHIHFETATHAEGRALVSAWTDSTGGSSLFRIHLRWHEALHHLALGDAGGVSASYGAMAADAALGPLALVDLASLLWRLRILPVDGDLRDVAGALDTAPMSRAAARIQPGTGLVDAHAGIAHALTGDAGAHRELVGWLEALQRAGHPTAGPVVLPLVRGVDDLARGRAAAAVDQLEPPIAAGQLVRLGGTNAQREVFEDSLIAAHIAAGNRSAAAAMLADRLDRRPSCLDRRWMVQPPCAASAGEMSITPPTPD
jgi:hypothetical protein